MIDGLLKVSTLHFQVINMTNNNWNNLEISKKKKNIGESYILAEQTIELSLENMSNLNLKPLKHQNRFQMKPARNSNH